MLARAPGPHRGIGDGVWSAAASVVVCVAIGLGWFVIDAAGSATAGLAAAALLIPAVLVALWSAKWLVAALALRQWWPGSPWKWTSPLPAEPQWMAIAGAALAGGAVSLLPATCRAIGLGPGAAVAALLVIGAGLGASGSVWEVLQVRGTHEGGAA